MSAQHTAGRIHVAPADGSGIGIANFQDGTPGTPRAAMALTGRSAGGEGWHYLAAINDHPQALADARRLAACWNACDGLSTDLLEAAPYKDSAAFMAYLKVEAQRDDLLAALEEMVEEGPGLFTAMHARALIAKMKGGAA